MSMIKVSKFMLVCCISTNQPGHVEQGFFFS